VIVITGEFFLENLYQSVETGFLQEFVELMGLHVLQLPAVFVENGLGCGSVSLSDNISGVRSGPAHLYDFIYYL
jgi:hypothetical protein